MSTHTDTTMDLTIRSDQRQHAHQAPSRPSPYQAACRPETRWKPACRPASACTPSCGDKRCRTALHEDEPDLTADQTQPHGDETAEGNHPAQRAREGSATVWSPGSNRSRTPITAGPTADADDRPKPTNRRPSPRPRAEDEWSGGRMHGVAKPDWGGKFASKMRGESGMSTAEYAVGTLAAVAFAGVLLKVLTSGPVQSALSSLIERALT